MPQLYMSTVFYPVCRECQSTLNGHVDYPRPAEDGGIPEVIVSRCPYCYGKLIARITELEDKLKKVPK